MTIPTASKDTIEQWKREAKEAEAAGYTASQWRVKQALARQGRAWTRANFIEELYSGGDANELFDEDDLPEEFRGC